MKLVHIYNGLLSDSNEHFIADLDKGSVMNHLSMIYLLAVNSGLLSDDNEQCWSNIEDNIIHYADNDTTDGLYVPIHELDHNSKSKQFREWSEHVTIYHSAQGLGYSEFIYN